MSRDFYRCYSKQSAGALRCGQNVVGLPLSKSELLLQFKKHKNMENRDPTALVSVTERPLEALHRAFEKYYNDDHEPAGDIWIAIISVPVETNDTPAYHHAEGLARDLGTLSPDYCKVFRYEYIFEWEIPRKYVVHTVSVETLLNRGLNLDSYLDDDGHLPDLREFRSKMINMILGEPLDGYSVGRELGRMARAFGARAPVKEIAYGILTDCPFGISVYKAAQYVKWTKYDPSTKEYPPQYVDFEHLYWISRGINEALFDLWLADGLFVDQYLAHAQWANSLTEEVEILRELYLYDLSHDVCTGVSSAADRGQALEAMEKEIYDRIERDALSIGL